MTTQGAQAGMSGNLQDQAQSGVAAAILAALPLPAVLVRADARLGAVNGPGEALLGRNLVGRHHVIALRQPALLEAVEAAAGGRPSEARFLAREAAREALWLARATGLPGGAVLVTFEDRTPADEAAQIRRDFVANVSHELRTPLTALLGFIETLRGPAREDPRARERFLAVMEREAGRMNRLVSDLLSLSRVEAQARQRPTGRTDLGEAALRGAAPFRARAEAAGGRITVDMPTEPVVVAGDPDQLQQVVANLVENAVKYAPGTLVTVRVALEAAPGGEERAAVVEVADEGDGIEAHHLPRLTERFYRIDGHRSRELGGTGLGLAIVQTIVLRHRGRLAISSAPGSGSRFVVRLPALPTAAAPAAAEAS